MSYSFLLKYIIIGDSGTHSPNKGSANPASCCDTPTSATARSTMWSSESSLVLNWSNSSKTA